MTSSTLAPQANEQAAPATQPTNRYYRVNEAAGLLQLSRAHLYRLMAHGELRYLQSGRARRISATAIAEYAARHEMGMGVSA